MPPPLLLRARGLRRREGGKVISRDTTKMLSYYYSKEYSGRILVLVLF